MSIGYACLALEVNDAELSRCILKNATQARLKSIIQSNLKALDTMIEYNIRNNIRLYRISSDVIPFGSHPVNKIMWWDDYKEELRSIGDKIKKAGIRVSMHPGQYTVLNSNNSNVVEHALSDLDYHEKLLSSMGLDTKNKIILHIGGVYGDKDKAMSNFVEQYQKLTASIKSRLVIENDDRNYTIKDVVELSKKTGAPVVFDNLHHEINPPIESFSSIESTPTNEMKHRIENNHQIEINLPNETNLPTNYRNNTKSQFEWIEECRKTWGVKDGKQKLHYSQQKEGGLKGAHSDSISIEAFMDFYKNLINKDLDIMLEVKDKNISAIKCMNAINSYAKI